MVDNSTRRNLLRSIGALSGAAVISNPVNANEEGRSDSKFYVEGTEEIIWKYKKNHIEVTKRKKSEDLAKRYGMSPPVLVNKMEIDRNNLEDDGYPERGTRRVEKPWNTYVGTEKEFQEEFQRWKDSKGPSIQHSHEPEEDEWLSYGVWTYEEQDGVYDARSPINILIDASISGVDYMFDSRASGWNIHVAEWDRYAWHAEQGEFVHQNTNQSSTRATSFSGCPDYRNHVRYWDLGWGSNEVISMQAHIDTPCDHEVHSYTDSMEEVREIFYSDGYGYEWAHENLENKKGDYSGWALGLSPSWD